MGIHNVIGVSFIKTRFYIAFWIVWVKKTKTYIFKISCQVSGVLNKKYKSLYIFRLWNCLTSYWEYKQHFLFNIFAFFLKRQNLNWIQFLEFSNTLFLKNFQWLSRLSLDIKILIIEVKGAFFFIILLWDLKSFCIFSHFPDDT